MEWKNSISRKSHLALFVVLLAIGVGGASAMITITLSGNVVITGDLDMTSDKIRNVGTPIVSSDVATKGYVDSAPSTDTLALLGCSDEEIPKWDGSQWICSKDFQTWNSRVPTQNIITTVDSGTNVGLFTSITIGSDNLPVISYHDTINDDLKVAKCNDPACTSSTKTVVDSIGNVGGYTSIAIGTDGNPVISYYDFTNQDLKFVKCGNLECSSGNTIRTLLSAGNNGLGSSIIVDTDGYPVISFYDATNQNLRVAFCHSIDCGVSPSIASIGGSNNYGLYSSIALGVDGQPIIAYPDITLGQLLTTHCANNCTSSITEILSSGNSDGLYPSITIGEDGIPWISHYESNSDDLRITKCFAIDCTTGSSTKSIDNIGNVGEYSSITLGIDGYPIISYYDSTNGNLKVAKCFDSTCEINALYVIDQSGNVGRETSIAVPPDGLPVISYRDFSNNNLKMVKCGNPYCFDGWNRR